ncbi:MULTISPECIES: LysR family transcriptional regulator [Enterobacteriaceae]|uniref:LysR family transcriptional regulator n=1 Tax=Enterobacteriaceae TaxID=543 RepID=UPI0015DCEE74|nr:MULTISPECIES: LysR family transcriptional regulator [unclassified Klebsiella]HAT3955301.1 LysR family transcriptional regulator [Kluyvera ascorbata]BBR56921.1 LysR family transcriptional regulator [Klebsiella sp. WP4-W18-ESBL-05]BBS89684.1 LysR family transcriptional regulator [Klebsiella sp. WP7-S18-CRE-02]BBS94706.1 LysR family transcriptional regulator [Klebsiella sp. WP7-S18-CRE-03]BBS99737.1 LysR family transcriptional regulator [Klebsiella sp. WP7-S18-ESBL-04]
MLKHVQDMALFALLVKNGSFTKTAAELGMTKSRISQRISALEEYLNLRLLNRTTRKISLTADGERYLAYCHEVVDASIRGDKTVQALQKRTGGKLKIIAPPGFMASILPAVHHQFLQTHSDIELQLITADSFYGSVGGEFDVAYRIGKPSDDTCIGRHLGTFSRFIVCTPAYLAQRDISRPEALQRGDLITHRTWKSISLFRNDESYELIMPLRHTSDNLTYILQQALQGTGIAILPEYIIKPYLQSGQLVTLLPQWAVQKIDLWMIYQSKTHNPAVLRDYINFITQYDVIHNVI